MACVVGFGVRVQPSGVRSYIVNYRAGGGGRRAANRRLVIGRHARARRRRRGPGRRPRADPRHAPPARGVRGLSGRRTRAQGEHAGLLPQHRLPRPRRVARPPPRHHLAQGCRTVLHPAHQRRRMGPGQPRGQDAARPLPAPVHRLRGAAQPRRPVARRRRAAQPPAPPPYPAARRGPAPLAPGHRGRSAQRGRPRRLSASASTPACAAPRCSDCAGRRWTSAP